MYPSRRKNTRAAGFQQIRVPVLLPDLIETFVSLQVPSRLYKSFIIFNDIETDPFRILTGPDENIQGIRLFSFRLPRLRLRDRQLPQPAVTRRAGDLTFPHPSDIH